YAQLTKVLPTETDVEKDIAALACLAQILGQGRTSVLYQQVVKPKKALSASASSQLSELAGEFTFRMTPYPGQTLADMNALLKDALASFETRGVTDEDIIKFKGGI